MTAFAMPRIDLRGRTLTTAQLRTALPRGGVDVDSVLPTVRPIVDDVAARGAVAALEYGATFDGVRPDAVRVPVAELDAALDRLDPDIRAALEVAIERTRAVHADQRRTDTTTLLGTGASVTERWVPVERVGLYVPGGTAVYPSSVVMNVVPAQAAGVESLVVASPPQAAFGGLPHPTILAAARMLGEMWDRDECDFLDVTMGLWRLQEVMREIAARSPADLPSLKVPRSALFSPMPGDQHNFGTLMIEEVFSRAGWQSEALVRPDRRDLLDRLGQRPFDMVGLTLARDWPSGAVTDLVRAMRNASANSRITVLVGGRMINENPGLVETIGADGTGVDALAALDTAESLMKDYAINSQNLR
jgi:methanogenic corrinoid protein MtbC1